MKGRAVASFENASHESTPGTNGSTRLSLKRVYAGDLTGEGGGELQAFFAAQDEFTYVGTDTFSGALGDRRGSFAFQHGGIHTKQGLRTFGFIAPGSGAEGFRGITGDLTIEVNSAGHHKLILDFQLP